MPYCRMEFAASQTASLSALVSKAMKDFVKLPTQDRTQSQHIYTHLESQSYRPHDQLLFSVVLTEDIVSKLRRPPSLLAPVAPCTSLYSSRAASSPCHTTGSCPKGQALGELLDSAVQLEKHQVSLQANTTHQLVAHV